MAGQWDATTGALHRFTAGTTLHDGCKAPPILQQNNLFLALEALTNLDPQGLREQSALASLKGLVAHINYLDTRQRSVVDTRG